MNCLFKRLSNKNRKSRISTILLDDLRKMSNFVPLKCPFYGMDFRKSPIVNTQANHLRKIGDS